MNDMLERLILDHIQADREAFARVEAKLDKLLEFRARVLAVATLVSAFIGIIGQAIVWLVGQR